MSKEQLQACIHKNLETYLNALQGQEPSGMYDMLLRVVEKPLLELVMQRTRGNQSKAAQWLGINRNTLRKLLLQHGLLSPGGERTG